VRARVKRWGKSPPHRMVTSCGTATPVRSKAKQSLRVPRPKGSGRPLEEKGNLLPREITTAWESIPGNRTRLT